jgi:hypothetical protein
MAFMLGSFTNGMFGAMDDVNRFMKGVHENRATAAMQKAANDTANASKPGVGAAALPAVTNGTDDAQAGRMSMDKHDDNPAGKLDPNKDVPQPKHLSFGPSAREHDNTPIPEKAAVPPAGTDMTNPNNAGGGSTTGMGASPVTNLKPNQTAQPSAELGNGYNPTTGTWQGAPTGTPAARSAAPKYLPTPANPSGGQPQTGFHAVFGANQAAPTQGAPVAGGPGTASPQMAAMGQQAPGLANGQSGLGAQLMAAMNPTSGATS